MVRCGNIEQENPHLDHRRLLIEAVKLRNVEDTLRLIQGGADVNFQLDTGEIQLGVNFVEHVFFSENLYSGIRSAIAMGNLGAIKLILKSGKFSHDYR